MLEFNEEFRTHFVLESSGSVGVGAEWIRGDTDDSAGVDERQQGQQEEQ